MVTVITEKGITKNANMEDLHLFGVGAKPKKKPIIYSDVNRHHYNLKHINEYLQIHLKNPAKKEESQILHDKLNDLICILYKEQY